ncbi:hypothetical protein [[Eubacterium] cellulosolvens]
MNNSWKTGAVSGLIAGLFGGIVMTITGITGHVIGPFEPLEITGIFLIFYTISHVGIALIFGIIFGIIYLKYYDSILGKGILKGLYFGLLLWLLVSIIPAIILGAIGQIAWTKGFIIVGFFSIIAYGLVLGYLHKPKK